MRHHPERSGRRLNYGVLLCGRGEVEKAENLYRQSIETDPNSHASAERLMELPMWSERYKDAIAAYKRYPIAQADDECQLMHAKAVEAIKETSD